MLTKVTRPDGSAVTFAYDALGRRIKKTYRGQTTRWVWDGNVPLHEWVEGRLRTLAEADGVPLVTTDPESKRREAELEALLAQGPPQRGTKETPITWLFEPESFAPFAKLHNGAALSLLTDHLGTPVLMLDAHGERAWSATIDVWGALRDVQGDRSACPFRWPGQYEDVETGLYYNRFRYYDAEAGQYVSQDPIGLAGGAALYAYARDPLAWMDPLGLSEGQACGTRVPHRQRPRIEEGNLKEGWIHIDARHVSGTHPKGPGDVFGSGTTRTHVTEAAEVVVAKGTRLSQPADRIQVFERRMKVNGRRDRVRVAVDSDDGNRVISIFPVRNE